MVGSVLQEMIEQVAIRPVYLSTPSKPAKLRVFCTRTEGLDNAWNFGRLKRAWRYIIGNRAHQAYMARGPDSAGSDRQFACQKARV